MLPPLLPPLLLRQHHGRAAGELLLCGARLLAACLASCLQMVASRHLPSMGLQLQMVPSLSQMVVLRYPPSRSQMWLLRDLPSRSQMVGLRHLPR